MGVHGQLQRRGRRGEPMRRRLRRPSCYQTQWDLGTCRGSQGSDKTKYKHIEQYFCLIVLWAAPFHRVKKLANVCKYVGSSI